MHALRLDDSGPSLGRNCCQHKLWYLAVHPGLKSYHQQELACDNDLAVRTLPDSYATLGLLCWASSCSCCPKGATSTAACSPLPRAGQQVPEFLVVDLQELSLDDGLSAERRGRSSSIKQLPALANASKPTEAQGRVLTSTQGEAQLKAVPECLSCRVNYSRCSCRNSLSWVSTCRVT